MRRRIWRRPTAGILNSAWTPVRHVRELDVAAELDVAEGAELLGHDVADRRDHRDAAVLLLDVAVPLELLRADAVGDADRVPEARRRLGAERVLVLVVRRRRELRRGPRRRGALERRGDRQAERERRGLGHGHVGSGLRWT